MPEPLKRIDNILGDNIGFVELCDQLGDDQRIAAAARVSLSNELKSLTDDSERQQVRDAGLINRLMREHHTSPFEAVVFQWRIRWPIFVARQAMRHRFSSWNEESARYTILRNEFYEPREWRERLGKAMDYSTQAMAEDSQLLWASNLHNSNESCRYLYAEALTDGVAPEHARLFLPVTQYTSCLWTVNALALLNFLHLRNSPHAQAEIRAYAIAIEGVLAERLPVTYAAYKQHWGDGIAMIV